VINNAIKINILSSFFIHIIYTYMYFSIVESTRYIFRQGIFKDVYIFYKIIHIKENNIMIYNFYNSIQNNTISVIL